MPTLLGSSVGGGSANTREVKPTSLSIKFEKTRYQKRLVKKPSQVFNNNTRISAKGGSLFMALKDVMDDKRVSKLDDGMLSPRLGSSQSARHSPVSHTGSEFGRLGGSPAASRLSDSELVLSRSKSPTKLREEPTRDNRSPLQVPQTAQLVDVSLIQPAEGLPQTPNNKTQPANVAATPWTQLHTLSTRMSTKKLATKSQGLDAEFAFLETPK
ncbi:hypothetical protein EV182_007879, partial [Spiromyces aspiralis]